MNEKLLVYEGPAEGLYTKENFSRFVLNSLAHRLGNNVEINPEEISSSHTLYHLPILKTGIQYLTCDRNVQVGLLFSQKDLLSKIILEEAENYS